MQSLFRCHIPRKLALPENDLAPLLEIYFLNRQVQNSDRINSDRLIRVGSTRINPDRPRSTWIDLNYNTIKEKGYYYAFIMKI